MSRVHQLIDHCTDTVEIVNPDTGITHERDFFDKERFAELIMRETFNWVVDNVGLMEETEWHSLKKHFGVEE